MWRKNGGPPENLPPVDFDASGSAWSDLENNEEGREACGWAPAEDPPAYDATRFIHQWNGGAGGWDLIPLKPQVVSRLQFRLELEDRGMLSTAEDLIAASPKKTQIYYQDSTEFHLTHPVLQSFIGAQPGWTAELLEEIFVAASTQS